MRNVAQRKPFLWQTTAAAMSAVVKPQVLLPQRNQMQSRSDGNVHSERRIQMQSIASLRLKEVT